MIRMSIEERRRQLIQAAIRVISAKGVAAATSRAIAREAGMPLGSVHYAFANQESLLDAVIAVVTEGERLEAVGDGKDLFADLGGAPVRPVDLIRRFVWAYLELLASDPHREQALLELTFAALRRPGGQATAQRQYACYRQTARDTLEAVARLVGCRWTRPPEEVAHLVIVMTDGLTTTYLATRDMAAARRSAATLSQTFAALLEPADSPERPAGEPPAPSADGVR